MSTTPLIWLGLIWLGLWFLSQRWPRRFRPIFRAYIGIFKLFWRFTMNIIAAFLKWLWRVPFERRGSGHYLPPRRR